MDVSKYASKNFLASSVVVRVVTLPMVRFVKVRFVYRAKIDTFTTLKLQIFSQDTFSICPCIVVPFMTQPRGFTVFFYMD